MIDFTQSQGQSDLLRGVDTPARRNRKADYYYRGDVIPPETYKRLSVAISDSDEWYEDTTLNEHKKAKVKQWGVTGILVTMLFGVSFWHNTADSLNTLTFALSLVALLVVVGWLIVVNLHNQKMRYPELTLLNDPLDRSIAHAARVVIPGSSVFTYGSDDIYRNPGSPHYGDCYRASELTQSTRNRLAEVVGEPWSPEMDSVAMEGLADAVSRTKKTIWAIAVAIALTCSVFVADTALAVVTVIAVSLFLAHASQRSWVRTITGTYPIHSHYPAELYLLSDNPNAVSAIREVYVPDLRYKVLDAVAQHALRSTERAPYLMVLDKFRRG